MADEQTRLSACGAIARFFDSAALSDYTLTCQGTEWKVHRIILSLHSSVLGKACNGEFREGCTKTYDLSAHSKEEVDALVKYIYTFDYEAAGEEHGQHLCFHVGQAILADKYDIPGLNKLATDKFKAIIKKTKHAAELVEATKRAYGAESVTDDICKSIAELIVGCEAFSPGGSEGHVTEESIGSFPALAIQIIKAMKSERSALRPQEAIQKKRYRCPRIPCDQVTSFHKFGNTHTIYTCPYCRVGFPMVAWKEV